MKRERRDEDRDPVEIDERRLDVELTAQPKLMKHACRVLAEARADERAAKDRLKLIGAQLGLNIRKTPEHYGHTSSKAPSNDVVEAMVLMHLDYRTAQRELNEAMHRTEVLEADVTALSHKKTALESLVVLYCRDYGSEVKLPRDGSVYKPGVDPFSRITRPIKEEEEER